MTPELARQNAVLNRFEEMLKAFQKREAISRFEAISVLLTSAAFNLGHNVHMTEAELETTLTDFVARVRTEYADHVRDCVGKSH